jgi:hypothetical protein
MSYYKYAERDADSQVNWGKITRDMTNMLDEQKKLKQDKRDALDKASREYAQKLTDAPMGDSELINRFTTNYADDARQYHLMVDNLLKSGNLDPREYTLMMQNLQTGTQNLFNLSKEYSEQYATAMERLKSNDPNASSQKLEQTLLASLEGYAKLGNHKGYINPTDGSLSLGKVVKGEDGVDKMVSPVSVSELRNRIKSQYDYYNYKETIDKRVNSLPAKIKFKEFESKYGKVMFGEVEDFTQFKDYNNWLNLQTDSMMENQFNISSILTDDIIETSDNKAYYYVSEEFDGDGNVIGYVDARSGKKVGDARTEDMIVIRTNGDSGLRELDFTDKQKERVRDVLKQEMHAQLPYKETFRTRVDPDKPTSEENKQRAIGKAQDTVYSNISQLYYGDESQITEAINNIRGLYPDLVINRDKDGVTIFNQATGKTENLSFKTDGGEIIPQDQWVKGSANFFLSDKDKIKNINEVAGRNKIDLSKTLSDKTGFGGPTEQVQEPIPDAFDRIIREELPIPANTFIEDDEAQVAKNLNVLLVRLPGLDGYSAESTDLTRDTVVIKNEKDIEVLRFDLDDPFDEAKYIEALYDLSKNVTNLDQKAQYTLGKRQKGTRNVEIPGGQSAPNKPNPNLG